MAYDERLAERVGRAIGDDEGLDTRKMFGGMAHLLNGNMACGVVDDLVVLRLGNEGAEKALDEDFIVPMDFTGKVIRSMVHLLLEGHASGARLKKWVKRATVFAATLPSK